MLVAEGVSIFVFVVVLHILSLALGAKMVGVPVRQINFGFGKELLRFGVVHINVVPFGGSVKLKDSRVELLPDSELRDAFDHQPRWVQAFVYLSGCMVLLGCAFIALGGDGGKAFVSGFSQVFSGALSPLSTAQELLSSYGAFMSSTSVVASVGLVSSKVAAVNLLPIPVLNGGQALVALIKPPEKLQVSLQQASMLVGVPMMGAWFVALAAFSWHAAT